MFWLAIIGSYSAKTKKYGESFEKHNGRESEKKNFYSEDLVDSEVVLKDLIV